MGRPIHNSIPRLGAEAQGLRRLDSRVGLLVLLFLGCLAPYATFFLTHHPDERHYTDAGIQMVLRGDYLTPYTADGALRLKKPIIPYWLTAVSYRCFGISPASSRLPFLLAGGLVVWLTYRLALVMLEDRSWALLAALVVACNPSLLISAPRSVPDVTLCLFLLLSTIGFVTMLISRQTTWGALAAAYGGGALAVESKGLPALIFVGYAVAFMLLTPGVRRQQNWRRHAVGWCLGLALAASWFGLMTGLHGDALAEGFLDDQIGRDRRAESAAQCVMHFVLILLLIGACFLPWLVPLLGSRFDWRAFASRLVRRPDYLFLLGWVAVWIVLASMVERVNLRYLLPLAPLLSVAAAHAWKEADPGRLLRAAQPGWWLSITALTVASTASAIVTVYLGHIVSGLLLIGAAAWIIPTLISAARRADARELARLAVTACLLMFASASVGLAHLVLPDVGARIAQELRELPLAASPDSHAVWVGEPAVAARVRVHLRGEIPLGQAMPSAPERLETANIVLLRDRDAADLGAEWSVVRNFTHGYRGMDARDLLKAALAGKAREFLDEKRQHITIAVRENTSVITADHSAAAGEGNR